MSVEDDVELLKVRVDELAVQVLQLTSELTDIAAAALSDHGAKEKEKHAEPMYESLDDWVEEYFSPTFSRSVGGELRWCAQWREHAEGIGRLEALWRSWEALRLDPALGMATWFTNYLDPMLATLLSRSGPFSQCSSDRHAATHRLPS
jgi:Domain of unknown function (DUF4913)